MRVGERIHQVEERVREKIVQQESAQQEREELLQRVRSLELQAAVAARRHLPPRRNKD